MSGPAAETRFERTPVNRFLGYRLIARSSEGAAVGLPVRPEFLQEEGVVQGGLIAALADTAAVYALWPELPEGRGMTSVEFKLNFLRPGRAEGPEIVARSRLVQRGTTIALCDVEVHQAERLLAKGLFTYLFHDRRPPAAESTRP